MTYDLLPTHHLLLVILSRSHRKFLISRCETLLSLQFKAHLYDKIRNKTKKEKRNEVKSRETTPYC